MSMVGVDRGLAVYNAVIASNPKCAQMTQAEKDALKYNLQITYSADTTYITSNAQINPGTLASQPGQPVSTSGSPSAQTGTTTAPKPIAGLGTIS